MIPHDSTSFCFTKEEKSDFQALKLSSSSSQTLMDCTCSNFRTSTAPLSWTPTFTSRLPRSLFLSKLKFRVPFCSFFAPFSLLSFSYAGLFSFLQKLKRLNLIKHSLVVMGVSGSGENGEIDRLPLTPNKLFMQEVVEFWCSFVFKMIEFVIWWFSVMGFVWISFDVWYFFVCWCLCVRQLELNMEKDLRHLDQMVLWKWTW